MSVLLAHPTPASAIRSGTAVLVSFVLWSLCTVQANADGAAVYASVTNDTELQRLSSEIKQQLGVQVEPTSVWVDGTNWIRLQSPTMSEVDARELVASARAKGYSAWYNSSGNQWATSAAQAPKSTATGSNLSPANNAASTKSPDWGVVKPAVGDVSHLPMAETFPIE